MGPKTICFMMDEFAKLPKSETVLTGPDLGRSKKVSYWLIFQARSQIVKTYSRSEEHTSELQSLMRISYAVFCLKKKITKNQTTTSQMTTSNQNHNTQKL